MNYTSGRRYGRSNFGSKPVETGKEYNVQSRKQVEEAMALLRYKAL
ncbi:MAG TPA: hypothetical protein VJ729_16915 [Nitrososphaeraceae archaeon]|nr:hypothetical protein [Nitrososphaeraceae archaeon]